MRVAVPLNKLPPPPGGWHVDWFESDAKKYLATLIKTGHVVETMPPSQVYLMCPLFRLYKYSNFSSNYRSLQLKLKKEHNRSVFDCAAVASDQINHPVSQTTSNGNPRWHGSAAQQIQHHKIMHPRFQEFREGKTMPPSVRLALYSEDPVENGVFGYARWSKFLGQHLSSLDPKRIAKKQAKARRG